MMTDEQECPLVADGVPHGRHPYVPLVVDPENDHVLHLWTDQAMTCPGTPRP